MHTNALPSNSSKGIGLASQRPRRNETMEVEIFETQHTKVRIHTTLLLETANTCV